MITFSLILFSEEDVPTLGLWQTNLPLLPALLLTTTLFGQTANQHQSSAKSATSESVEVHLGKGTKR
jgi:hypothetical protein